MCAMTYRRSDVAGFDCMSVCIPNGIPGALCLVDETICIV